MGKRLVSTVYATSPNAGQMAFGPTDTDIPKWATDQWGDHVWTDEALESDDLSAPTADVSAENTRLNEALVELRADNDNLREEVAALKAENEALKAGPETPATPDVGLDVRTVPELEDLAKAAKIDLKGATKKADIIAAIRAAQ